MAFDFPASPTTGQTFTSGGVTYVYNGYAWAMQGAGSQTIVVSDTAPTGVVPGVIWWESDSGILWLYYDDGNTQQWVEIGGGSGVSQTFADQTYAPLEVMAASGMQVNGSMDVAQQYGLNTTIACAAGVANHVIDGFKFFPSTSAVFNARQVYAYGFGGGGTGLTYCLQMWCSSAATPANNDVFLFQQIIEGYRFAKARFGTFGAMPVTIGFWIAATVTGIVGFSLRNAGGDRSYVVNVTVNAANTFEWKTVTIPGCPDGTWNYETGNGVVISWVFGNTGTQFQGAPNTWISGNIIHTSAQTNFFNVANNSVFITGLMVIPGSFALSQGRMRYAMRPFDQELALCMRYYEKSYPYSMRPGTNPAQGYIYFTVPWTSIPNGAVVTHLFFKVPKRVTPVVTVYGYHGTAGVISDAGGNDLIAGSGNVYNPGDYGFTITANTASAVSLSGNNYGIIGGFAADARL